MVDNNENVTAGIDLRETVDGVSVDDAPRTRKAQKKVVTRSRPDPYIWGIYIMLLLISIVELFSASSSEVSAQNVYSPLIRHSVFLIAGLVIVIFLQNTHYIILRKFAWLFALFSLGLLLISSFMGIEINGAQRAISILSLIRI